MAKRSKDQSFEVQLQFAPRVIAEHLGRQKYSTSTKAIGELVANALDAGADLIQIDLHHNDLGGLESLTILDNGVGMSAIELQERFGVIGVKSPAGKRLGRFGVGRLAIFRIGGVSEWSTTANDAGAIIRLAFTLRSEHPDRFHVEPTRLNDNEPTGTHIRVFNLLDSGTERLTVARVQWDLIAQYCGFLLANPSKRIIVQGTLLDPTKIIEQREEETLTPEHDGVPAISTIDHLLLKAPIVGTRFPNQLLFAAKGITVESAPLEDPPSPTYVGIVQSSYLDEMVTSNREAFIHMDGGFVNLRDSVLGRVKIFGHRIRRAQAERFIERARKKDFYPYRVSPIDEVTRMEQTLYDRVLELVNVAANIEGMGRKQQHLVFDLLHRALKDENLLQVLDQLATLSTEDMSQFRELLERTTLQAIVRLASEVTERLTFLDILHDVVYGDLAKHVRERSQLHKLLEANCWLFGSQYHLATSDKSFRDVVRRHRERTGMAPVPREVLNAIPGVSDIPDLFLAAQKEHAISPPATSTYNLVVELKRPSCVVGNEEFNQIRRYARFLSETPEVAQATTRWDVFLISANVHADLDFDRSQNNKEPGLISDVKNVRVWVLTWGEIVQRARTEMRNVREHLQLKSLELSTSDYLRQHFPVAFPTPAAVPEPQAEV